MLYNCVHRSTTVRMTFLDFSILTQHKNFSDTLSLNHEINCKGREEQNKRSSRQKHPFMSDGDADLIAVTVGGKDDGSKYEDLAGKL